MSFGPIINESSALTASGVPTDTGTLHIVGPVGAGDTTKANVVTNMDEFEGIYADRSNSGTVPLYDALDGFFNEGGARAVVGAYSTTGSHTYADGLALLNDKRLGPGQMAAIGTVLTSQVATDVLTVAGACNRVALFDVASGDTVAEMEAKGDFLPDDCDRAAVFGSWASIPGPAGVIGAGARTIPASPIVAALCNRVDVAGNPGAAPGGRSFPLQYVTDLLLDPSDTDRAALWTHGVNAFGNDFGVLENLGFQTNIAPTDQTPFWQLNPARARMWLHANAQAIAAPFYMQSIDGQGRLVGQLVSQLEALCSRLYEANGLYGATYLDAYKLTPIVSDENAANGKIQVKAQVKLSLYAKSIEIDLVSVPILGTFS